MKRIAAANEPDDADDPLPKLPPLDRGNDDDVPLVELDQTWIAVEDAPPTDPDLDEAAIDLDVGVRIDEPSSPDEGVLPQEIVLDMSELLNVSDDDTSDEAEGLDGMDPAVGIEEPPTTTEDGASEGVEEEVDYLVAEQLPSLDADEEGLFDDDPGWTVDQGARDEPPPPWADPLWSVVQPAPHQVRLDTYQQRVEVAGGNQVVCAPTTSPRVAIVLRDAQLALARQQMDDSYEYLALDETGRRVAGGQNPVMVARGEFVCLGDEKQGIAVSTDGGRTYEPVPGCAGVTALTLGNVEQSAVLLAALHREATDVTELACVDLARLEALRVATLETAPEDDFGRITLLIWDEEAHALLAEGDFGSASIFPPRQ